MRRRAAGVTVAFLFGAGLTLGFGGSAAVAAPVSPTTTTLSVTPMPPQPVGTTLIFTAALTPDSVVGTCTFYDGASVMLVETSHFKSCALQTDTLAPGPHTLRVTFVPTNSGSFGSSEDEISFFVGSIPLPTSVSLSASKSGHVVHGTQVTFSAVVAPSTAPGQIRFVDGSTTVGVVPLGTGPDLGTATLTTAALPVGSQAVRAEYVPSDADWQASTSDPVVLSIDSAVVVVPTPTVATKAGGGQRTDQPAVTPIDTIADTGAGRTQVLGRKLALTGAPALLATGTGLGLVVIGLPLALVGRRSLRANGR